MNDLPFQIVLGMPMMAEDAAADRTSMSAVLGNGAKMIYSAQGMPFKAEALRKLL